MHKKLNIWILFLNLLLLPSITMANDLNNDVIIEDLSAWEKYVPTIREYDSEKDALNGDVKFTFSPHKTRKITVESSDLTKVPYASSVAKITVFDKNGPLSIIEIHGHKNYDIKWLNEELLHIQTWPGRCIQIDMIININSQKSVYSSALNHCAAKQPE